MTVPWDANIEDAFLRKRTGHKVKCKRKGRKAICFTVEKNIKEFVGTSVHSMLRSFRLLAKEGNDC